MDAETAIRQAKGLRKLPEDERRILIEEASECRTIAGRGRPNHLLDRNDDNPQTVHDEAAIV
jgi:hypothetical protein